MSKLIPKKIICFSDSFNSGGAQKQLMMLANGLVDRNYEVATLQYYNLNFFSKYLDNRILRIEIIHKNKFIRIIKILYSLFLFKPNCIISFLHVPNNYAALYKVIFFWRKTTFITGERNLNVADLSFKDFLIRIPHLFANRIVCNSNAQLLKLKPYFGKKLKFIANGTDSKLIKTKNFNYKTYSQSKRRFIVSARFTTQKNPLLLLKAIKVLKNNLNFEVHWYGEVSGIDPIVNECYEYIEKNELGSYFILHKPTNNIYDTMVEYDALILPSLYEGCPNAIIDAMFCGLPVLASNVSDNSIYLSHQQELIFNPTSVDDLVDKLIHFINLSIYEIEIIGKENIQKAHDYFDQKRMVNDYIKLLES